MRELKDHIVEGDLPQNQLKILVMDEPGAGGASHYYQVSGFDLSKNPSKVSHFGYLWHVPIFFQNGPIKEAGLNGITQEVLLAIVIDRLRSFQSGPFPCQENENALKYCELALRELKIRTERRLARGVEGQTKA
jgi:hypothetical protein